MKHCLLPCAYISPPFLCSPHIPVHTCRETRRVKCIANVKAWMWLYGRPAQYEWEACRLTPGFRRDFDLDCVALMLCGLFQGMRRFSPVSITPPIYLRSGLTFREWTNKTKCKKRSYDAELTHSVWRRSRCFRSDYISRWLPHQLRLLRDSPFSFAQHRTRNIPAVDRGER